MDLRAFWWLGFLSARTDSVSEAFDLAFVKVDPAAVGADINRHVRPGVVELDQLLIGAANTRQLREFPVLAGAQAARDSDHSG